MTGFDYTYTSSKSMLELMSIANLSVWGIAYLIVWIIFIFGMVFYLVPHIDTWLKTRKQTAEKKRKKQLMNKIVLQKNLEDVIAKELKKWQE